MQHYEVNCPCGSNYTHQIEVFAFTRDSEDAQTGTKVRVLQGCDGYFPHDLFEPQIDVAVQRVTSMADNPSSRRDGVRVVLRCELCDRTSFIEIVQHKGQTLIKGPELKSVSFSV